MRQLSSGELVRLQRDLEQFLTEFTHGPLREMFDGVGEPVAFDAAAAYVTRPSKRLLGMGFLVAYYALAKTEASHDELIPIAAALEIRHAAILLHDDIVDGDQTRGGHSTAHHALTATPFGPEGASAALFAGDVLAAMTPLPILRSVLSTRLANVLTETLLDLTARVGAGQIEQLRLDTTGDVRDTTEAGILHVHGTNFQAYLGCSVRLACQLIDLPEATKATIYDAMLPLGRGFQVQNDVAGITELARHLADTNPDTVTLANTSDLGRRRRTTVIRAALDLLPAQHAAQLAAYINGSEDDITELLSLIVRSGAVEHCRQLIDRLFRQAQASVENHGLPLRDEEAAQTAIRYMIDLYDPATEVSRLYLEARPDINV